MDGNISKSPLKNIIMYVRHVRKEYKNKRVMFTWILPGFFKQNSALYTKRIESLDFDLKLTKDKNSFDVRIDTNGCEMFQSMLCNVYPQGAKTLVSIDVPRILNNLYHFTFQPSVFKLLKDCALSESIDTIKLQFEIYIKADNFLFPHNYDIDHSRFEELREGYVVMKRFPGDFTMQTNEGTKLFSPKSLLAARCKFFRNYFNDPSNNTNQIQITSSAKPLGTLLYYFYCGDIYIHEEYVMLGLVKLAWELDVPSLKNNYADLIRPFLNSRNVHEIREEGIKTGLDVVVKAADNFLANMHELKSNKSTNV